MEKHVKLSVFLSFLLRHKPEAIGLTLDDQGYLSVDKMMKGINKSGKFIDKVILDEIVSSDSKQRYSYNDDKSMIRANQGHSLKVDLGLTSSVPTSKLYHGTAEKCIEGIEKYGLLKGSREHVHLSDCIDTALSVGARHGVPIIYNIDVNRMIDDGYIFWLSENNVWLSDNIPTKYLSNVIVES